MSRAKSSRSEGAVLFAAAGWHDESPGGANKLPTDFARYLVRRGYRVAYLCPSTLVGGIARSDVDGVDLWRYESPKAPSPSLRNLRQHWTSVREIVGELQAVDRVDTLLGHAQLQALAAASMCPRQTRRCYTAHSPLPLELAQGRRPTTVKERLRWQAAKLIERRVLGVSDIVQCYSQYSRGLMESLYPRTLSAKGVVLPGWVDGARFHWSSASRDQLRADLGPPWERGIPTFFSLRRLVPRMGLDTLIDAAAMLAVEGRDFRIVIGGEGPQRPQLEALALERRLADRVHFLGRISEEQLSHAYTAADCFVLPTRALECFGLIVLEAYASGLPVVGVPVGAIPEVMGAEFARWVADDNQPAALARRMDDFLSDRLVADPIRLRCRAMEFEMERVAEQHERVLVLNERAASAQDASAVR